MNDDGWDRFAAGWREQPAARVDLAALSRKSSEHGRHLRRALALELLVSAVAVGLCAWVALSSPQGGFTAPAMAALGLLVIGSQAWSLWIRRRQLQDCTLDPLQMLQLERDRLATSLRYWRINLWWALVAWIGLWLLVMAEVSAGALVVPLLVNVPVLLAFAIFAWWKGRRTRVRLADAGALLESLSTRE